ncbi:Uncharacterized protein Anas_10788 [Armadillidium nasatum]|uniref:DUF4604 domain-containing protein n=1 Tax=Armadillidium nasatum TaxID=96803 RepID=A0A5N5SHM1_9CRUS|nr:Uncharacterized protein Anas_10788 [Armadillidium nasatum]
MAKWTGKKSNVMFSKPEEPSFLKKFKEKVGYKEDKGLEEKFEEMPKATAEDFEDRDDELPQVVQLKPGDLSQEEFDDMAKVEEEPSTVEKSEEVADDGKILFRQPAHKRSREASNDLKASTKKTKKEEALEEEKEKVEKEEVKKNKKKEKSNRTLLSFDEEDDTEDT